MKKKTKPAVKPALPEDNTLSDVALDLAQRIYAKAVERAETRKEEVFRKILDLLRLEYINLDEEAGRAVLADILAEKVTERLISAEIIRMNTAIAFLAKD